MRLNEDQLEAFIIPVMEQARVTEFLPEFTPGVVVANWRKIMAAGIGRAYGITREGKPAGFLLATHANDMFSGKRKGFEFFFEVDPKYRSDAAAMELISEFEQGAREDGCESIVVGCHAVHKPEALGRYYRRKGFKFLSASFERKVV